MRTLFTPAAIAQMARMPRADARRIRDAARLVAAEHPARMPFVTEIVGRPGVMRIRKGDYRAIYAIEGDAVVVTQVGHRKDIYQ